MKYNELENSSISLYTHEETECMVSEFCPIHKRSEHSMRGFPQFWRPDRAIMERTCPHGIGHPDPDEYKLYGVNGKYEIIHTCDGCCNGAYPSGIKLADEGDFQKIADFLESENGNSNN